MDIVFDSSITYPATGQQLHHKGFGGGILAGSCVEADYDNLFWIFGLWTSDGVNFTAVCHHEFYPKTCPIGTTAPWINAVGIMHSTNGGASFLPPAYTPYQSSGQSNSSRLVLVPRPSSPNDPDHTTFGFYHPSNIVEEDGKYYVAVGAQFWLGSTNSISHGEHEAGLALVRTSDLKKPSGWEVHTNAGWQLIDHNTFQGRGGQEVTLFHRQASFDPYTQHPTGGYLLSFSLVRHKDTGQWIAFGYSNQGTTTVQYMLTDSLADPNWGPITAVLGVPALAAGNYPSLIDHDSSGHVFQFVSDTAFLYFVAQNGSSFVPSGVGQPTTDLHSRSIWRIPLQIVAE